MYLSEVQTELVAKAMFEDRETKWIIETEQSRMGWDDIEEAHRKAWRDTVSDTLRFACPILEDQFTEELEEIFTGFFKGFLEARALRNEVKI